MKKRTHSIRASWTRPLRFLLHPRIVGHGPTLHQGGLPSTRRLTLVSNTALTNGAVALHYRRADS